MDTNETRNERPTEPFTQVSGSVWRLHDDPPQTVKECWSDEKVCLTNYGDVFLLKFFGTKESGVWQRPFRFNDGEKVEWWMDKPTRQNDKMSGRAAQKGEHE